MDTKNKYNKTAPVENTQEITVKYDNLLCSCAHKIHCILLDINYTFHAENGAGTNWDIYSKSHAKY